MVDRCVWDAVQGSSILFTLTVKGGSSVAERLKHPYLNKLPASYAGRTDEGYRIWSGRSGVRILPTLLTEQTGLRRTVVTILLCNPSSVYEAIV